MPYQSELSFLCDVFRKTHVSVGVIDIASPNLQAESKKIRTTLGDSSSFLKFFSEMSERTMYIFTDAFKCSYIFLLLKGDERKVMFVGPYLSAELTDKQILEIAEKINLSAQKQRYLSEYYMSLAVLTEDCPIMTMLNSFCERMWRNSNFSVVDVIDMKKNTSAESPFSRSMLALEPNDILVNMRSVERRYEFENEMMRAVSLGHSHMENKFRQAFSASFFEKRVADPLRNAKNYSIIMNTLLRKSAENGGVHPIYLDRVSSDFATKIEGLRTLSDNASLMVEMFRTYCRLVRTHSSKEFSNLVQRTILIIESDLSADLSSKVLAETQGVSLGYLSSVFKKETGQTVSSYIRKQRMEYASYLLEKTNLQIQNVALHCGIMDVQYFTKLFKNHFGKTPSEYRRLIKLGI
ncbi:MAG: helix-turn-helix transcriptional regulator [Clostridia bacterium]|nr:helix-turn-helix transcriptional regulator [Clostridia bacterium]